MWFLCINRDVTFKAQPCPDCIKNYNNPKPLQFKSDLGTLLISFEPNEDIQMDFAGPLTFCKHKDDYYLLPTVDRLTRYPHAQVYRNCNTETALKYIEENCSFHGIPRFVRCNQAQAFKERKFEICCKDKNRKLNLDPAGDHRLTGMAERLIQTIKRRIAIMHQSHYGPMPI